MKIRCTHCKQPVCDVDIPSGTVINAIVRCKLCEEHSPLRNGLKRISGLSVPSFADAHEYQYRLQNAVAIAKIALTCDNQHIGHALERLV